MDLYPAQLQKSCELCEGALQVFVLLQDQNLKIALHMQLG